MLQQPNQFVEAYQKSVFEPQHILQIIYPNNQDEYLQEIHLQSNGAEMLKLEWCHQYLQDGYRQSLLSSAYPKSL
ncbi:hypothetical protein JT06_00280 [Desulfobulbus sp. Tol-SR]|nr:hypothetical protein JT06_00280 [Desulfobulbus sp. Tol-SR]